MFCLASTIAVYSCFEPLVMYSYEAFPRYVLSTKCVMDLDQRSEIIVFESLLTSFEECWGSSGN